MSRKQPELRKQELIQIAMRQFMMQGYEKTSIRSIVKEAEGEVGMFYHHFSSKEEIFKAVLKYYNLQYISRVEGIIREEKESAFTKVMDHIFEQLEGALEEYQEMYHQNIDSQMLSILHQNTLMAIQPLISKQLQERISAGSIPPLAVTCDVMAEFLLFGISAVIHDPQGGDFTAKRAAVTKLLNRQLGLQEV